MKRFIFTLIMVLVSFSTIDAQRGCRSRLTQEEFYERQREFFEKEAVLTKQESDQFFVLYFELQKKKRANNHKVWELMHNLKNDASEQEYDRLLKEVYRLRLENTELDSTYYLKYKEVIPSKKIYKIFRAEPKFQREIIRGMNHTGRSKGMRR